jgi:hypothetical protein
MLNIPAIADLREKLRGPLLTPDAQGYDAARKVFNGMVDKHQWLRRAERLNCAACQSVNTAPNAEWIWHASRRPPFAVTSLRTA